jgi:hypothetical protein
VLLVPLLDTLNIFLFFNQHFILLNTDVQYAVYGLDVLHVVVCRIWNWSYFRTDQVISVMFPYLLDFIFFILAHPFVFLVLLLIDFVKDTATLNVSLIALQEKPFYNVGET